MNLANDVLLNTGNKQLTKVYYVQKTSSSHTGHGQTSEIFPGLPPAPPKG